jgi:hypothetical protein
MKLRSIAVLGGLGVASIALIGMGAGAVFTQNTVSSQTITAGTMNVQLSTTASGAGLSPNGQVLTFAPLSGVGSSFTTGDQTVVITNYSTFPVKEITATPGDSYDSSGGSSSANSLFAGEAYLCEVSSGEVIYNGLLADAPAQSINGTLSTYGQSGDTDNYTVNVYAGTETTACGAATSTGAPAVSGPSTAPSLLQDAQGGVIDPSLTVSYTG